LRCLSAFQPCKAIWCLSETPGRWDYFSTLAATAGEPGSNVVARLFLGAIYEMKSAA